MGKIDCGAWLRYSSHRPPLQVKKVHRVALDALFTPVDIVPMTEEQIKADKKIMQGIKKCVPCSPHPLPESPPST